LKQKINIFNKSQKKIGDIKLGFYSQIIDSQVEKKINVNNFSTINRALIGNYFGLGNFSYVADAKIGRYCSFGSRVSIGSFDHPLTYLSIHEFQYRDIKKLFNIKNSYQKLKKKKQTIIENDVWIGDNSFIKSGVKIGNGAVIAASSVVTKNVEPYSIVGGNPSKIIKYRFDNKTVKELLKIKWWELNITDLEGCNFQNINDAINFIKKLKKKISYFSIRKSSK